MEQLLWILIFATPLVTISLAWRLKIKWYYRLIVGTLFAAVISLMLYLLCLILALENGLGPS